MKRIALLGCAAAAFFPPAAFAQQMQLDPKAVIFSLTKDMKWNENTRAGNRNVVLHGDPSKPGPYVVLMQWLPGNMSRPHFHPNDRFFYVISGTWWTGTGGKFEPDSTVPIPAGSFVTHYGKQVHYDGAKDEVVTFLIWGEGPATSTPFQAPAQ